MRNLFMLLSLASLLVGCSPSGIPIMGLDDNNNYYEYIVEDSDYASTVAELTTVANTSLQPSLQNAVTQTAGWQLQTIVLGLGLKMEGGVGPILTGSIQPRFRLAFSNSSSPVIP